MVSTVSAQDLNYEETDDMSSSFSSANFTKESGLLAGVDLSFLSFFDAPSTVETGQEVEFSFENEVNYVEDSADAGNAIDSEDAKFIVEVYDCNEECGSNDRFVEGIRFTPLELLEEFESGDVIQGTTRYSIPSTQDGPMKATSYIWVQEFTSDGVDNDGDGVVDNQGEALISDSPAQEFVVQGDTPEGGDDTVGPGAGSDEGLFSSIGSGVLTGLGLALFGVLLLVYYFVIRE